MTLENSFTAIMSKSVLLSIGFLALCSPALSDSTTEVSAADLAVDASHCVDCADFIKLPADRKEAVVWEKIKATKYKEHPQDWFGVTRYGTLAKMAYNGSISTTFDRFSDEYPISRVKTIHTFGSVAKVKVVMENTQYTGLFRPGAANHGLLRYSLVKDPFAPCKGVPFTAGCVAPSMALKVFRGPGYHSGNIIAQYNLGDGQGEDFNLFRKQQKSWVPTPTGAAAWAVVQLFRYAAEEPQRLSNNDFATDYEGGGQTVDPINVYFVPNPELTKKFKKEEHEFREDLESIPAGTKLFDLVAPGPDHCLCGETNEPCTDVLKCKDHVKLGEVVSTSEFISSSYGDRRLFFQHERYAKKDRFLCKNEDGTSFGKTEDFRRAENHNIECRSDEGGCPKKTAQVASGCPYAAVWQQANSQ